MQRFAFKPCARVCFEFKLIFNKLKIYCFIFFAAKSFFCQNLDLLTATTSPSNQKTFRQHDKLTLTCAGNKVKIAGKELVTCESGSGTNFGGFGGPYLRCAGLMTWYLSIVSIDIKPIDRQLIYRSAQSITALIEKASGRKKNS